MANYYDALLHCHAEGAQLINLDTEDKFNAATGKITSDTGRNIIICICLYLSTCSISHISPLINVVHLTNNNKYHPIEHVSKTYTPKEVALGFFWNVWWHISAIELPTYDLKDVDIFFVLCRLDIIKRCRRISLFADILSWHYYLGK